MGCPQHGLAQMGCPPTWIDTFVSNGIISITQYNIKKTEAEVPMSSSIKSGFNKWTVDWLQNKKQRMWYELPCINKRANDSTIIIAYTTYNTRDWLSIRLHYIKSLCELHFTTTATHSYTTSKAYFSPIFINFSLLEYIIKNQQGD